MLPAGGTRVRWTVGVGAAASSCGASVYGGVTCVHSGALRHHAMTMRFHAGLRHTEVLVSCECSGRAPGHQPCRELIEANTSSFAPAPDSVQHLVVRTSARQRSGCAVSHAYTSHLCSMQYKGNLSEYLNPTRLGNRGKTFPAYCFDCGL